MLDQENSIITTSLIERQTMDTLTMLKMLLARGGTGSVSGGLSYSSIDASKVVVATPVGEVSKIIGLEKKLVRYKDVFTKLRQKYKEVVYLLTGWKINMDAMGSVTIAHMYATSGKRENIFFLLLFLSCRLLLFCCC
jgi:hypothetical protein